MMRQAIMPLDKTPQFNNISDWAIFKKNLWIWRHSNLLVWSTLSFQPHTCLRIHSRTCWRSSSKDQESWIHHWIYGRISFSWNPLQYRAHPDLNINIYLESPYQAPYLLQQQIHCVHQPGCRQQRSQPCGVQISQPVHGKSEHGYKVNPMLFDVGLSPMNVGMKPVRYEVPKKQPVYESIQELAEDLAPKIKNNESIIEYMEEYHSVETLYNTVLTPDLNINIYQESPYQAPYLLQRQIHCVHHPGCRQRHSQPCGVQISEPVHGKSKHGYKVNPMLFYVGLSSMNVGMKPVCYEVPKKQERKSHMPVWNNQDRPRRTCPLCSIKGLNRIVSLSAGNVDIWAKTRNKNVKKKKLKKNSHFFHFEQKCTLINFFVLNKKWKKYFFYFQTKNGDFSFFVWN